MGHLKRHAAPEHFDISVKAATFTVKPSPGPHPIERCIPLLILIRDHLKYAETAAEAKKIIKERKVLVDWRVVTDHKFPIGLMDVVSLPETGEHFRILPVYRRGLTAIKINEDDARLKVCRIIRKLHVNEGHLQITLHDGRNIRYKQVTPEVLSYKVGDSLIISFPEKVTQGHLKLAEENYGLIFDGEKQGLHGRIVKVDRDVIYPSKPTVTLQVNSEKVTTLLKYVIVVGEDRPVVMLG